MTRKRTRTADVAPQAGRLGHNYCCRIKTFLFLHCRDLGAARHFYGGILGLTETYFSADDGTVGYQVGTLQISVATHADAAELHNWSEQLGWKGGTATGPSWSFECTREEFRAAVEAAQVGGVQAFHPEPEWVGYWSYPVRDPMGNTVEITTPDKEAWQ